MNDVDVWADTAIKAMLMRIREVCIYEYRLLIDELRDAQ